MKSKIIIVFILVTASALPGMAQQHLNAGLGYFGQQVIHPGVVLEMELEKFHSHTFSLPLRANVGYCHTPDYQYLFFDLHKGLRKYVNSSLFFEQSLGVGVMATDYRENGAWYIDQFNNLLFPRDGLNISFMPSVTLGVGYDLSEDQGARNRIWIRSKIYWNLGLRGMETPFTALMVGYSHTLNTHN
ncbi:MAG: hypothetical protein KDC54_13570 [Lewinella sp.]|nr:hypothetical protein [Lewinella sp.]